MKTVSIPDEALELLDKIVKKRNADQLQNRHSNRSIVTELIAKAYSRECKK